MLAKLLDPIVTGIIRSVKEPTLGERERDVVNVISQKVKLNNVDDLFFTGETYEVK